MTEVVVDAFPYPFSDPVGQQLHRVLTELHPTTQSALYVAESSGIAPYELNSVQPPFLLWSDILRETAATGRTRALVKLVCKGLPQTSPSRPFLASLLAGDVVRTGSEPIADDGTPAFVHDDDTVEPEALLYQDDLTLQIGRVPALIDSLTLLLELAPAVCLLTVDIDGDGQYGTGFRIGPDLLLTNWHVVHSRRTGTRATAVTAEFGFDDDGKGGVREATAVPCDTGTIVTDKADDWAVMRTADRLDDRWPTVNLSGHALPALDAPTFIVQHPQGQRKRLGFVRNKVTHVDDRVVHYLTDTQVGSSGSPVFDAAGRLVAVHHAGGRPQPALGRSPVRKNEGILAARIAADCAERGLDLP